MDRQKRRYLERRGIKVDAHDGDGRRKEVRVRGRGKNRNFVCWQSIFNTYPL